MDFVEGFAVIPESDFAFYLTTHGKFIVSNFLVEKCQGSSNNGMVNSFSTTTPLLILTILLRT